MPLLAHKAWCLKIHEHQKLIIRKELVIILFIFAFTSSIFADENFNIKEGVTTKKEVDDKWGEPTFVKNINGTGAYYYEFDDKTGYFVLSFDSRGIVKSFLLADKTINIACPNCLSFLKVLVKDPFNSIYTCDKCGYKFSKTEGIGALERQRADLTNAILQKH